MRYWLLLLVFVAGPAFADPTDDYVACVIGKSAVALHKQPLGEKDAGMAQKIAYGLCSEPKLDGEEGEGVSDYINISVEAIAKEVWGVNR